jgi:hypothetical protein
VIAGPHRIHATTATKLSVVMVPSSGEATATAVDPSRPAALRTYSAGVRQQLRVAMLSGSGGAALAALAAAAEVLPEEETDARSCIVAMWALESESAYRAVLAAHEQQQRAAVVNAYAASHLAPWCTRGCRYCCATRQEWDRWESRVHLRLCRIAAAAEAACRTAFEDCEAQVRTALADELRAKVAAGRVHQLELELLHATERTQRAAVEDEAATTREISVNMPCSTLRATGELAIAKLEAYDKYMQVLNMTDALNLQEGRVQRQLLHLTLEREAAARNSIVQVEELKRARTAARSEQHRLHAMRQVIEDQIAAVTHDRDALQRWKDSELAARASSDEAASAAAQAALMAELREIRRIRKAGGDKTGALPPCPRCKRSDFKDYALHRTTDCPERPAMCTKCDAVMALSELDAAHRAVCPQRTVACAQCGNFYRAEYIGARHAFECAAVAAAREALATPPYAPVPVLTFAVGAAAVTPSAAAAHVGSGGGRGGGAAANGGGSSLSSRSGKGSKAAAPVGCAASVDVRAFADPRGCPSDVCGAAAPFHVYRIDGADVGATGLPLQVTAVGTSVEVLMAPAGASDPPPAYALAKPYRLVVPPAVVVLAEYETLSKLVADDDAQLCKPELPVKKASTVGPAAPAARARTPGTR